MKSCICLNMAALESFLLRRFSLICSSLHPLTTFLLSGGTHGHIKGTVSLMRYLAAFVLIPKAGVTEAAFSSPRTRIPALLFEISQLCFKGPYRKLSVPQIPSRNFSGNQTTKVSENIQLKKLLNFFCQPSLICLENIGYSVGIIETTCHLTPLAFPKSAMTFLSLEPLLQNGLALIWGSVATPVYGHVKPDC